MATTSTIYGKSAYYGYSNYTNSAGTHMYVGDKSVSYTHLTLPTTPYV